MSFNIGDRVKIKDGVDLEKISIILCADEVKRLVFTISSPARPGRWGWDASDLDETPTYDLSGWCIPESYLELVEEEKSMIETVYKRVAVRDGRYWSCFVGVPKGDYAYCKGIPALEYIVGQVTESPTEAGIFCVRNRELAVEEAKRRKDMWDDAGLAAVLECYPIGGRTGGIDYPNYPAVYVVGEIWREAAPACPFKVGDRVRFKDSVGVPRYGDCGTRNSVGVVTKLTTWKNNPSDIEVSFPTCDEYVARWDELELVPVEEWVGVTEECEVRLVNRGKDTGFWGYKIELRHSGEIILEFGDSVSAYKRATLKVERETDYNQGGFKILKKVIK